MLQSIMEFVRANELGITFGLGLIGIFLYFCGEHLLNRYRKRLCSGFYDQHHEDPKSDKIVAQSIMITGCILALASCIALGVRGYYAKFLDLFR